MKKTKLASALLMLSLISSPVLAGAEGSGGGAGICKNGKCITLPEAGFRIVESSRDNVEISADVVDELEKINFLLPKQIRFRTDSIVGNPGDVVFVEVANTKKMKKFMRQYADVLGNYNSSEYSQNLELLGFTTEAVNNRGDITRAATYILNDKFQKMSTRSQALLLIHEHSLRVNKLSLDIALKYDGALIDLLNAIENGKRPNIKKLLIDLKDTRILPEKSQQSFLLAEMLANADIDTPYNSYSDLQLSYKDLLLLKKSVPDITNHVKPGEFFVDKSSRAVLTFKFFDEVRRKILQSGQEHIIVTNELFDDFISRQDAYLVKAAKKCGNVNDHSYYLAVDDSKLLKEVVEVGCSRGVEIDEISTMMEGNMLQNIIGLNLNLKVPQVCRIGSKEQNQYYKANIVCKDLN